MPIYEYRCKKCGELTESLRTMAQADDPAVCEHCGSKQTYRAHSVFSAAAGGNGGGDMPPCPDCSCGGGACPMM